MTQALRLATFNVENLDDTGPWAKHFELRVQKLRPQFEALNADIICLQEVDGQRDSTKGMRTLRALDRLIEGTKYETYERAVTLSSDGQDPRDAHNLVVLSRFPILQMQQLQNDLVPAYSIPSAEGVDVTGNEIDVRWDRPLLAVHIDIGEPQPLRLINCHLRASSGSFLPGHKTGPFSWKSVPGWAEAFYISDLKRSGQALEARLLVDQWFDEDPEALIAVCGDMNAEPGDVPLRILEADLNDTGNEALRSRAILPLTRHMPPGRRHSVIHQGNRQLLDHILVSHGLMDKFQEIDIHNDTLRDEVIAFEQSDHPLDSFHAPLVAKFG